MRDPDGLDDAFYNVSPALFEADTSLRWDVASPFDEVMYDEEGMEMEILRPRDLHRVPFLTRYVDIDDVLGRHIAEYGPRSQYVQFSGLPYERLLPGYMYK